MNKTNELEKKKGRLDISFDGQWFLIDAKTKLIINGELHSTHSTKKGFYVSIPIQKESITLKVVLAGIKSTIFELEELDLNKEYHLGLIYDTMWGKYSNEFNFSENG